MKLSFLYQLSILLLFAMLPIILTISPASAQVYTKYYDVVPNVGSCSPGTLKDSEKQKVLELVNRIRLTHGLKPVVYDYSYDDEAAEGALMMAANDEKVNDNQHVPPQSWKCWNQTGANGLKSSNLARSWRPASGAPTTVSSVIMWMIDNNVMTLGHRRWLIDPFLKFIAIGRADGVSKRSPGMNITATIIYVISQQKQNIQDWDMDFVAYPYGNYPPEFFYTPGGDSWYLSFTAIFDKTNYYNNANVDFSEATVEMEDRNGNNISITETIYDNGYFGVPNCLKWLPANLQQEKEYFVTIKNVKYGGETKDYSYSFTLTNKTGTEAPDPPALDVPANGSHNLTTSVLLKWAESAGANYYNLQVAENNTFDSPVFDEKNLDATEFQLTGLDEGTEYFWRSAAGNDDGLGDWSQSWSFATGTLTPGQPALLSPPDAETGVSVNPLLTWSEIQIATHYQLQAGNSKFFNPSSLFVDEENLTTNSYQCPDNTFYGMNKYYWRVKAFNDEYEGEWSEPFSFTTNNPLSAESDNPVTLTGLYDIFPNPLTAGANIGLYLNYDGLIKLEIYNSLGNKIDTIYEGFLPSGNHHYYYDAAGLLNGIYYLKLSANGKVFIRKLQIVR